jgi:hypothetical protein
VVLFGIEKIFENRARFVFVRSLFCLNGGCRKWGVLSRSLRVGMS